MGLPARNEVEALVELDEQAGNLRGIVLEIGVDRDDDLAAGLTETRRQRRGLPEVAAQPDNANAAQDAAGFGNTASNTATVNWDVTPPAVAISAPSPTVTASGPVSYTVTYSDANGVSSSSLTAGNITLTKTGTADASSFVVSGGGTSYTVTLSGISGDGTFTRGTKPVGFGGVIDRAGGAGAGAAGAGSDAGAP